ncbi:MAG: ribokinase [Rhizobiales bacterium]|nr:ribokinase [Hyphomicrobiales bacterium]
MLLVLGNACRDITFRVAALPAPGETLNALDTVSGLGGKGLNQAIAAARTGAVVRFVAAVGNDAVADTIRAALRAESMTDAGLIAKPGETDLSAIIVASSGENMIVTNAVHAASLGIEDIAEHMSFAGGDTLLLQGNLPAETSIHAAKRARASGARVVFNPAPYHDWCKIIAHDIDVLILNAVEAERWSGASGLERSIEQLSAPVGIVTCGPMGCLVKKGRESVQECLAPRVKAEDATGAGDTFCGVFTAEWMRTGEAAAAVRLALAAASDSVTRPGALASVPSREALAHMRRELR